ncbi:MAG: LysM domain-containing protein [Pseudomonadota bacterium]|nr:LysM domain-containing protein [Pseudomonadota bacterium]
MQVTGARSAPHFSGFDAVSPPPAPEAPAAAPAPEAAPAPAQSHPAGGKGPLRADDAAPAAAQPTRQIPDWVPGQPPAPMGLAPEASAPAPAHDPLQAPQAPQSPPRQWHMHLQHAPASAPPPSAEHAGHRPTPIAQAAAQAAATAPAAPAAPKADPMEIAALELMLAEPENQEMIRHFGGERKPLPTWTTVGQGIEARYGQDLGSRLYQLQNAQRAVETEFFNAMDAARQAELPRLPQHPMSMRRNEPAPESGVPGWVYKPGDGHWDGSGPSWAFDPAAFARTYAQGDSPAQRAFAHLHGNDPVRRPPARNTEEGDTNSWSLNGRTLVLGRKIDRREEGLTSDSVAASQNGTPDWAPSRVQRPDTQLDPDRITKLHNKEFVWFDPQLGFVTDEANLRESWIDRAFPAIVGGVMSVMSMGAASAAMGITAGSTATVGQSMVLGAVGNATMQVVSSGGRLNFGSLLQATLSAGLSNSLMRIPGLQNLGASQNLSERLMGHLGRAGVQGVIQQVNGGSFRDGFVNSALSSVAGEVTQHLNVQIDQMQGLSAHESSTLRLLARAAGSALRVAGSGDPAAGFANDFLTGILGDAMQNQATGARAQGQAQQEAAAQAQPGQTPAANSTVTVGRGDTLEQLARTHYGENWRAGLTALVAANPGLRTNRWGSPLITPGQTLNAPSLQGLSAEQLARLGHTGGQIIGRNSQGLNARAQWLAAQQARAAAQAAARQQPQGMSPDEAHARYMAGGSRSDSYQRALGENYRTTWHTPAASRPGSSALTQTLSDIAARTAGAITGTAGSFADMAEGSWRVVRNSALQVGDILTFGYNHDHPVMQQAWSEQQQLGQSIVTAMLSPRETTSRAIESVVNRYEAAMRIEDPYAQSQALGRLFNDVGQAALGLGYSSPSVFRSGMALGRAIGENAFTGPPAGSRWAQRGAVGDLGVGNAARGDSDMPGSAARVLGASREEAVANAVGGVRSGEIIRTTRGRTDVDVIDPAGNLYAVGGPAKANNMGNFIRGLMIYSETAAARGVNAYFYYAPNTPQTVIDAAIRVLGPKFVKPIP